MESSQTSTAKKTALLVILDGWGHREEVRDNAIANAHTPTWDRLLKECPNTLISSSGESVGLPAGQMGNSEVGHMSLGAGRIVYQSISRIDKAIADGDFFDNSAYCAAIDHCIKHDKGLHLFGLLSPGGVHSHEKHFYALLELAAQRGARKVYVHAFLDGRDTPPRSAAASITRLEQRMAQLQCGTLVSLIGRYYAMDRDNRWERVEQAYRLLTETQAQYRYDTALEALQGAYQRDENDEFVSASVIQKPDAPAVAVSDDDAVVFMNFRADRARELSRAFVDPDFTGFERRRRPQLKTFVSTTQYAGDLNTRCAFAPLSISNSFGELMEQQGKTQLRIAETEKYAHVTFFFSGGREQTYQGEERIMIPSPDVATYDLQPQMSAEEVTDQLQQAIASGRFDAIICNYANGDMVGHTGNYLAAMAAAEAIDASLAKIVETVRATGADCLITADHGNCEQMQDYESGQPHTQHTTEMVPLVYVGGQHLSMRQDSGKLADIAPTLLKLMGLQQPPEMTGAALVTLRD